ncbi:hypothetical protein GCM10010149_67330 [Nonomuraea roseoviolacea subsp. roseoviolacea]|uniref:hypothetical protein n=1 Tax=Nonomuraea roseoviolacea TaxID=103837 RepID=UPI0031D597B9
MSDGTSGRYRAGETALLAVVGEAEPVVGPWRQRFDSFASAGVPTPAEPFRALTEAVVARWHDAMGA